MFSGASTCSSIATACSTSPWVAAQRTHVCPSGSTSLCQRMGSNLITQLSPSTSTPNNPLGWFVVGGIETSPNNHGGIPAEDGTMGI